MTENRQDIFKIDPALCIELAEWAREVAQVRDEDVVAGADVAAKQRTRQNMAAVSDQLFAAAAAAERIGRAIDESVCEPGSVPGRPAESSTLERVASDRALRSPATVVQPRSVPNDGTAIVGLVIGDLRERARHGEAKCGTKLQAGNGRVALVDAYQEVLDLAQYIRQELEERRLAGEIPAGARRRVLYFAAPLRPTDDEIARWLQGSNDVARLDAMQDGVRFNVERAKDGLRQLRRAFPETTFIAPWIASVMAGEDDSDPAQREAGLLDDCAVVERCNGIVLWGSRLSDGMRREMEHGERSRDLFEVYNLVGVEWQMVMADTRGMAFADWYSGVLGSQHPGSF